MTDIVVSNNAELTAAIKRSVAGDVIKLNPGTYSNIVIDGFNKGGHVTIASANPNNPAVIANMAIKNSDGLNIKNVEMLSTKNASFYVSSSKNVSFDGVSIHGSLDGNAANDFTGISIRDSSYVSITNSHFAELSDALNHYNSDHVTIAGNTFKAIQNNAIAGGGTSHLSITGNYITAVQNTDWVIHPDAIQIWTTNTKAPATDILVSGNVIERGDGAPVQGIWIRDETGTMPYERVTVTNNTIIGTNYHGIGVADVKSDLLVSGNTVVGYADNLSWIRVVNSAGAKVLDNVATYFTLDANVVHQGNVVAAAPTDAVKAAIAADLYLLKSGVPLAAISPDLQLKVQGELVFTAWNDAPAADRPGGAAVIGETVVTGTAGDDKLKAGAAGDYRLEGGAGNDSLYDGGSGTHTLVGGAGNDTYYVTSAKTVAVEAAGGGTDTLVTTVNYTLSAEVENIRANAAGLELHGNALANSVIGSAGQDKLYGEGGNDTIQGGDGHDSIYGGASDDNLKGDAGNDVIYGDDGADRLFGGDGTDTLYGGSGNDTLEGGAGADTLWGGTGADVFLFRSGDLTLTGAMDTIRDFSSAEGDKINLSMIDARLATAADDPFTFIGTAGFHKVAGELRYAPSADGALLMGDFNGDGVADFKLFVSGVTSLSNGDLWL